MESDISLISDDSERSPAPAELLDGVDQDSCAVVAQAGRVARLATCAKR